MARGPLRFSSDLWPTKIQIRVYRFLCRTQTFCAEWGCWAKPARGGIFANMNDYSDFEPTYTPRRKDNGRWCVVLIRADGSEREIGDFASDSEAWDWINANAGKQISDP
jgi:hypothetical protein